MNCWALVLTKDLLRVTSVLQLLQLWTSSWSLPGLRWPLTELEKAGFGASLGSNHLSLWTVPSFVCVFGFLPSSFLPCCFLLCLNNFSSSGLNSCFLLWRSDWPTALCVHGVRHDDLTTVSLVTTHHLTAFLLVTRAFRMDSEQLSSIPHSCANGRHHGVLIYPGTGSLCLLPTFIQFAPPPASEPQI